MLTVFNVSFSQLADLRIKYVDLEQSENLESHRTNGFRNTKSLVVRRGAPFKVSVQLEGRPFNPKINTLRVKIMLGFCLCNLYAVMPVTFSKSSSKSSWNAYIDPEELNPLKPSVYICSPASASVGSYRFQLCVLTQDGKKSSAYGNFILLCNPWCSEDTVYIPFEDQREEYIQSDFGLLFMGSGTNIVERPWSFDQYESGVLEACLNLLQVSPQHKKNRKMDYLNRNNPVYLSRVVSAMVRLFHVYSAGSSQGVLVFLTLDKSPIVGEPVSFSVKIMNKQNVAKMLKIHLNAQAKEYNHSPSDTFWENHGVLQLAPMEVKVVRQKIPLAQYEDVVGDNLINLAVVVEDTASLERVLSSEEFNITSPQLIIQVADEKSIKQHSEQTALVTFINPYSHRVSGVLTVAGAGLLQGKVQFRVDQPIPFMPNMVGEKMLQASLWLTNMNVTIRGFKMVSVNSV
uniref:Transglutaminase 5, like n=1 Tax=Haplochromis burtoni TaxID=8153 RepID=A0A3Q2WVN1_HAPBU